MADKSNFTPDEWKLVLESVMTAGIAVSAADPSGLWGLLKESFASGTELAKAKMDPGTNALIKATVEDFGSREGRSAARDDLKSKLTGSKPAEIKDKCIETLRQAAAVIDAKAPGDAVAFKGWLRQISQHVAEASKEGGFLGIGGVPVSEAEKATLAEISSALKLQQREAIRTFARIPVKAIALRRGYGCIQYCYGPRGCVGFPSRALLGWTVRGAHSSGLI